MEEKAIQGVFIIMGINIIRGQEINKCHNKITGVHSTYIGHEQAIEVKTIQGDGIITRDITIKGKS